VRFEQLHPAAQGVGRDAQAPRGLGKAAAAHHLNEESNVIEIEHGVIAFVFGRMKSDSAF
jgi:hypothetical protein